MFIHPFSIHIQRDFALVSILATVFLTTFVQASADEGQPTLTLERDVRPLLKEHCFDCHGANKELKGGLDLRLARLMIQGGESGPAIVRGAPEDSLLMQRIADGEMPPNGKRLSEEQVSLIRKWIAAGAPTARPEPETIADGVGITQEERAFWSFQPIQRPTISSFAEEDRVRNPIDALILQKMQPLGLGFSSDASKRSLAIRLYLDLVGLPPRPAELDAYLQDDSSTAYESLVNRLLESPHYGERWARHWLDVAGYADSEGYSNKDADRPWAYFYRDYVIRSLNADKPFDRFIHEQLAGDEMASISSEGGNPTVEQIEMLTATGYLRMAADGTGSGANDDVARNQTVADTLKIVSSSLLGLSVGCAQCHDHRYDPIPQKDYYSLRAIFEPALNWKRWRTPQQRRLSLYTDADRAKAAEIEKQAQSIAKEKSQKLKLYLDEALEKELAKHPAELRERLKSAYRTGAGKRSDAQKKLLKQFPSVNISAGTLYQYNQKHADELKAIDKKIADVRAKKPAEKFLRVLRESGPPPKTFVFHRGEFKQPTDSVEPAALSIASPSGSRAMFAHDEASMSTSGRRLAYAKWLTNGQHPLLARVLVNRIWMHHFGRGIVGTPADFGVLGQRPSHPKLLDWLAAEFMEQGWSLKHLHRLIVTSTTYRQTSVANARNLALDGPNHYYWKFPVRRLDAEILRDRVLATSGELGDEMFGPPVNVKADDAGQVLVDGDESRRSIYVRVKRTQPVAMLKAFDAPVMQVNCESRPSSTVAPQSLLLMNSEFMLRHAAKFADRVLAAKLNRIAVDFDLDRLQPGGAWRFGYGRFDESTKKVVDFKPLPHWTGSAWQGGPKLPDPKLGFVLLRSAGGHPASNLAAVRRWIAPRDGLLTVTGQLGHGSENGDGVRGLIVSSRSGLVGKWMIKNGNVETNRLNMSVARGDTLDFVVDCGKHETSDSFTWPVNLTLVSDNLDNLVDNSTSGFHGPSPDLTLAAAQVAHAWGLAYCRPPTATELSTSLEFMAGQISSLDRLPAAHGKDANPSPWKQALTNFCHVLMSSNEFLYVE